MSDGGADREHRASADPGDAQGATGEELAFAGVRGVLAALSRRELSARELVATLLARIERIDGELGAFRCVFAERALAEAEQADARRAAGDERPLLGLPVAIKDDQDVAGELTTRGTLAVTRPAARDSELVRRLRAAGAVVVGKTNVPELTAIGATESLGFGVTRNPWERERTPGGSSGGSAAAVAAGLVPAATASDGAGSIRIPAACCHLVGLKPARGLVPTAPAENPWNGLIVYGFLTRTVADTALLLDAVAERSPDGSRRKWSEAVAERSPDGSRRKWSEAVAERAPRLRIAVSTRPQLPALVDASVRDAVERVADELRQLGHTVDRADPPYGLLALPAIVRYLRGIADDAAALDLPARLQRRTRGFVRLGRAVSDRVLDRALAHAAPSRERFDEFFSRYDLLVTPTVARPPVAATEWEGTGALRTLFAMGQVYPFTIAWNHLDLPALALPAGIAGDGLPRSVQLVAPRGAESLLMRVGAEIEAALGLADPPRPPLAEDGVAARVRAARG